MRAHGRAVLVSPSSAIELCSGGDRGERGVTCFVDGDTGWEDSRKWCYEGIDTPEVSRPDCEREERAGRAATCRLQELMASGYRIEWSGEEGSYGRELVTITLADGRDAGEVLIDEGLSQRWPNIGNPWCD